MKRTVLLMIIIAFFLQVNGQDLDKMSNSLVWEITDKNSNRTTYLVFTTSGTCENNPALLAKVSHLRNNIKSYYTETGIGNPKNEKESQKYAFVNDSNESVKKLVPADLYDDLKSQVSGLKLPDSLYNLSSIMINGIVMKTITPGCNNANVTEGIFKKYAANYNIEVRDLISVKEAFKILNSYGHSYYVSQIQYMLQHKEKVADVIVKKASLYRDEDLSGIQELYAQNKFLSSRYDFDEIEKERLALLISKVNAVGKIGGGLITLDLACIMNEKYNLLSELKILGYDIHAINN